jgi:NAD(P)-dependent dehydrogenase (short-subunit alcohol dehydrogenase family)
MGALEGRVAIITGAGRGLGREHALLFAAEGARVVVNDLGGSSDGSGAAEGPAHEVVAEIEAMGGQAVANADDITDWDGGQRLIQTAVNTFGDLHVLVNNAGILRDRLLVNMTEDEWDTIMRVHLRGHFVPTRHAAEYWRNQSKAGETVRASVINTSSGSGLFENVGQSNYGAAKTGIATFSNIIAKELDRYGARVNTIAPTGRTRLTLGTPGMGDRIGPPEDGSFDVWDPANVSPAVAWLATEDCPATGKVFIVRGGQIQLVRSWSRAGSVSKDGRWTVDELAAEMKGLLD